MAARHKKAAGGKVREDYYAGADSNVAKEASDENESNETNDETPAEERAKAKFKPYRKGGKGRMMKGVAAKHMSAEGQDGQCPS
jgi:hypothetical protein